VRARVNPKRRGTWFDAASGQMFRQNPGATKNNNGSSGTSTPHRTNSPMCGQTISDMHRANPATTLRTRSASQTRRGTRGLICM
jgi:hypothetical protein